MPSDQLAVIREDERTVALAEGFELEGEGDPRFPRAGGGVEDDVVAGEKFEDGFFLVVVGLGVGGGEVVEENVEELVRGRAFGEVLAVERGGHAGKMMEEKFTAMGAEERKVFWGGVWRLDCESTSK